MRKINLYFHKNNILSEGFTIIKNVISVKECKKLKLKAKKLFLKYSKFYEKNDILEDTIYNLHNKGDCFLKYIDHKKIFPIIRSVLSTGSYKNNNFITLRTSAIRNPKFGSEQQLHNDSRISGVGQPLVLQAMWLLDDFSQENGSTRIVPGSHKKNQFPENHKKYKSEKILTGKKGSVIIFDAATWHGSAKKTVNKDRWGMIFSYSRWFFKPSYDHNLNTPLNVYKKMNLTQKELMGFRFNPPKDEFGDTSSRSKKFNKPKDYKLPK